VDSLFISYAKPYGPITAPRLGRYLCALLKATGIKSNVLKAHSVREASITAGAINNVPLPEILRVADWFTPSKQLTSEALKSGPSIIKILDCTGRTSRSTDLETLGILLSLTKTICIYHYLVTHIHSESKSQAQQVHSLA